MTTISASEARTKLYRLLDQTSATHKPLQIRGRRSSAVLVSSEDWSSIEETLYLLSIPGMRDSIVKGMKTPASRMLKKLSW